MDRNAKHLILVVDDVAANVRLLVEILRETYRVVVATDGPGAIQRIREQPPDLILLDVMMPGMDGFEVCKRLKMSPATSHIPVIFVTAKREMVDETRGFDLGPCEMLPLAWESAVDRSSRTGKQKWLPGRQVRARGAIAEWRCGWNIAWETKSCMSTGLHSRDNFHRPSREGSVVLVHAARETRIRT